MSIVSAIVLFAVVWFMTLFVVLPIRLETQGDVGERVEGTHAGSPASSFSMKRKAKVTTLAALPIWALICAVVLWGGISVRDMDWFGRMEPRSEQN
jgi:predicted secreted protein